MQYSAGSINVFAKYEVDSKKASGSLHTSLNSDLAVAMSASVGPEKGSKETSVDVNLGAQYTIDGASSIKGKVDKKGIMSVCYVSKQRKDLELKVTASIDSGALSQSNKHQWGISPPASLPLPPSLSLLTPLPFFPPNPCLTKSVCPARQRLLSSNRCNLL